MALPPSANEWSGRKCCARTGERYLAACRGRAGYVAEQVPKKHAFSGITVALRLGLLKHKQHSRTLTLSARNATLWPGFGIQAYSWPTGSHRSDVGNRAPA